MFKEEARSVAPLTLPFPEEALHRTTLISGSPDQCKMSGLTPGDWLGQPGRRSKARSWPLHNSLLSGLEGIHGQESGNQRFASDSVLRTTGRAPVVGLQRGLYTSSLQIFRLLTKARPGTSHVFWVKSLSLTSFNSLIYHSESQFSHLYNRETTSLMSLKWGLSEIMCIA